MNEEKNVGGVDNIIDDNEVTMIHWKIIWMMNKVLNMSLMMKLVIVNEKIYMVIVMIQMTSCTNDNIMLSLKYVLFLILMYLNIFY